MRRSRLIISFVSIGLCMLVLAAVAHACDLSSVGAAGPGGGAARPGDPVTFNIGMTGDPGPGGAHWTVSINTGSGYHEVASGVSSGTTSGSFTMPDLGNSPRTVDISANLTNSDTPDGSHAFGRFEYQPAAVATSQPAAQAPAPQHSSTSGGSSSASGSPARSPSAAVSQPAGHATPRPTHAAVPTSSSSGSGSSTQGQVATSTVATSADATSAQGTLASSAPAARAAAAHQARAGRALAQSADRIKAGAPPLVRKLRIVSSTGVPTGAAIPAGLLLMTAFGAGTYLLLRRRGGSPPVEAATAITPPAPDPDPTGVSAPLSLEDELDQLVTAGASAPSVAAAGAGDAQSQSPAEEREQAELLS